MTPGTIYDNVKNDDTIQEFFGENAPPPVVIDITNVAEYVLSNKDHAWSWDDFPNIAPPFERFWMEYKNPDTPSEWIMCGFKATELDADEERYESATNKRVGPASGVRWEMVATIFFTNQRLLAVKPPAVFDILAYFLGVAHDGRRIAQDVMSSQAYYDALINDKIPGPTLMIAPFGLALSLMHCKNVIVENHEPPRLSRILEKRGVKPRVRYHTLAIEPMRQVLRREGQSEKTGLKRALHICRGHFKDYSKHGLFGKYKGMYWWESHARGSADEGVVIKDYAVKQPRA